MGAHDQGADAVQGRWLTLPRTLTFIFNGGDVLLMKRAAHRRVFPNRYNGVGGHIERDEDPYTSARRELREETGLDVPLTLRAVHHIDTGVTSGILLFVFIGESRSRDVRSDEREGTLHWVPLTDLDQYDLVEDIALMLPRITAANTPLFAHVSYDAQDAIVMRYAQDDDAL